MNKIKNIIIVCLAAVIVFGFAIWSVASPDKAISDSERRPLAQAPTLSISTVTSGKFMTDYEDYTVDQFPLRDGFRKIKSFIVYKIFGQKDNNDIFVEQDHASKIEYPLNSDSIIYAADRFDYIIDKYADPAKDVYFCIIPDKNAFITSGGYPTLDYTAFSNEVQNAIKSDLTFIDISALLSLDDYFTTDIHWKQDALVDIANKIASEMGVSLRGEFTEVKLDNPFYGVYYSQAALNMKPDEIIYLDSDIFDGCTVYNHESGTYMDFYDMDKAFGRDPYEMFLGGSLSLITIENPNATTDKEIVIFRDSFGSTIAPLFVEGYAKITLVDIRYVASASLGNFVDFEGADILFMYSVPVLNNSSTIK